MSHQQDPAATALDAMLTAWCLGASPWDAEQLGSLYTEHACLFGGRPGHSRGQAEITEYFASYDGVIVSGSIRPLDQEVSELDARTLVAQGHVEFTFHLATGNRTTSVLRSTLILSHKDGVWRISHHHFSPIPEAPPLGA